MFRNHRPPPNRPHRPPSPPPPYDYPRKDTQNAQNLRKRKPENDTSLDRQTSPYRSNGPPTSMEAPKPNNVTNEKMRSDEFSGTPHFLIDKTPTNNILAVEESTSNLGTANSLDNDRSPKSIQFESVDEVTGLKSQEELNSITSGDFEKLNLGKCCKCLKSIDQESPKEAVPCKHVFHLSCITDHFRNSQNCPLCEVAVKSLNF
ncbi:hypothetical protein ACFFRR_000777 [Megaselia abdita]